MSRPTARRRSLMTGPWPHPKSGILYYRKATPPVLFAERERFAELGIKVPREAQQPLETKDRKPAEPRYRRINIMADLVIAAMQRLAISVTVWSCAAAGWLP